MVIVSTNILLCIEWMALGTSQTSSTKLCSHKVS